MQYLQLPTTGKYHRALADAEIIAHLVMRIRADLKAKYAITSVPHEMLCLLQKAPKAKFDEAIQKARLRFGL